MSLDQRIYPLKGKVQHYSWGGFDFIPQLLGISNTDRKPYAEYWMGAHPNHPSTINRNGSEVSLYEQIQSDPSGLLGSQTAERFGGLPFLFKVLDVRQMLSIQVHPDKESARKAYRVENEAGVSLTAPNRNYKDENHKPELMVALSDFWLLHGFKPVSQLKESLSAIPEFDFLLEELERGGYEGLYRKVMELDTAEVNRILAPMAERILPLYRNGELPKESEDFWAARALETFCTNGVYDRGIFSIYFFNLVNLKEGEGIYQPEGLPHAYLEGQNIEIMANSDNVLRAGLTDKHIDVPELLKHVRFAETVPHVLGSSAPAAVLSFQPPASEFELHRYALEESTQNLQAKSAEILLVLEGTISLQGAGYNLGLQKGETAFIPAGTAYVLQVVQPSQFFRAAVPSSAPAGANSL